MGQRNEFFIYYLPKTYTTLKRKTKDSGLFIFYFLPIPVIWALHYLLYKVGSPLLVDLGVSREQECEKYLS